MRQYLPEPRHYELMTILSPEIPDDEIPAHVDQIAGYVTSHGGVVLEINRESPWGRRRLAYPIRHQGRDMRDGYYTVFRFRIAPSGVAEIERDLRLHEVLIRHLITQQDEPAPVETPEATGEETETPSDTSAVATAAAEQTAAPAQAGSEAPAADVEPAPASPEPTETTAAEHGDATTEASAAEAPVGEPAAEIPAATAPEADTEGSDSPPPSAPPTVPTDEEE